MLNTLIIDRSKSYRSRLVSMLVDFVPEINSFCLANDIDEASSFLGTFLPDIIVMDVCKSPDMGIGLLKKLSEAAHKAKIVILTNYDEAEYREQCINSGADYFLSKHENFDDIIGTFKSLIN